MQWCRVVAAYPATIGACSDTLQSSGYHRRACMGCYRSAKLYWRSVHCAAQITNRNAYRRLGTAICRKLSCGPFGQ